MSTASRATQPETDSRLPIADVRRAGGGLTAAPHQPAIRVKNLTKTFTRRGRNGGKVIPVDNVSIDIEKDDLVVLLGPSGCGKTTLLRCVAGLERPDSGEIEIGGRVVFSSERGIFVPPEDRGVNMIFQSYALWPHMTVAQNVAFPLRYKGKRPSAAEARQRVSATLETVGLGDLGASYPSQISGGQQQRVALARAIVAQDQVILFDEPLSNVDAKVRERLRVELLEIKRKFGFSALYVTHDQSEAMELADQIAVLSDGKVMQYDSPERVYREPANDYVGKFIGSANTMPGTPGPRRPDSYPAIVEFESRLGPVKATVHDAEVLSADEVTLLSRPEQWRISTTAVGENLWRGTIETVLFSGSHTTYRVRVGDHFIQVISNDSALGVEGDAVIVSVMPDQLLGLRQATAVS